MNYISTAELSVKWNISPTRITVLAKNGRIKGAKLVGKSWIFPENSQKPSDNRTKSLRKTRNKEKDNFRYSAFEYRDINDFDPPLTKEELQIKTAKEAFYACKFKKADNVLNDLPENASDKYIRINALYVGCMIDIYVNNTMRFHKRHNQLKNELKGDFPHKKEMQQCLQEIDASLGSETYYEHKFKIDPSYVCHDSFLPHLISLTSIALTFTNNKLNPRDLNAYEINCMYLEKQQSITALQSIHINLGIAYACLGLSKESAYHLTRALELAEKYDLYFEIAGQYYNMQKFFNPSLLNFSNTFKNKLKKLGKEVHNRYVKFMDTTSNYSIYKQISPGDQVYLYYAVNHFTNKEVAKLLNISESTVGKHYGIIYATLGVNGKKELVDFCNKSVENPLFQK